MIFGRTMARDRARGHSPAPFTPRSIANLVGWWNASVLGLADLDPISSIRDQSGKGNDASQGTSSKRPTFRVEIVNGRAIARFDGVDDALTGSTSVSAGTALTYLAVLKAPGATAYGTAVSMGIATGNQEFGMIADGGGTNMAISNFAGPTATDGDRYTTTANNSWHVCSIVYAPTATPEIRKDGGSALGFTTAIGDWTTVNINNGGASYPFALGSAAGGAAAPGSFDLAMAMIYDRALSDAERSQLERWLGSLYGIAVT
ncbi:MAG: hypothetical protein HY909_31585 [Deltaproteobacteria bacterium]|nr:hypothetical protein [Deltaproteobacteria bacterium]